MEEILGRTTSLLYFIQHGTHKNDASNNSSTVACVSVAKVTFLPSRCLATIRGVHIQTHRLVGGIYEVSR
jgi:hypothetical protein